MTKVFKRPKKLEGDLAVDDRGQLVFINKFEFKNVRRFYIVENFSTKTIRAFHGHAKEEKYIMVFSGSILLNIVKIDDFKKPSKKNKPLRFVLSSRKPEIIYIPAGFANGFRSLEKSSKIVFFSTFSLSESKKDDYRYAHDYWGKDIWKINNR